MEIMSTLKTDGGK